MQKMSRKLFLFHIFAAFLFLAAAQAGFGYYVTVRDEVVLDAERTIDESYYVVGSRIVINGTVDGDLWAIGREVQVNGRVDGTVYAIGWDVSVSGEVGEGVTAAARRVQVSGDLAEDVIVLASDVTVSTTVPRDVFFIMGQGNILGPVEGGIRAFGRVLLIDAPVDMNVVVWVRNLFLGNEALLRDGLVYTSGREVTTAPGADVEGSVVRRRPGYWMLFLFPSADWPWRLANFFMQLLVGLVFILLASGWMHYTADSIRVTPGACAGWGAVALIATPVAALVALVTVIGIALAVILMAVYLVAVYLSQIVAGLFLGKLILIRDEPTRDRLMGFASLALGLVILNLIALIPWIGPVLMIAAVIFGLGALLMSGGYTRAYPVNPEGDVTRPYERG
jgi:hypothetical protein